MNKKSVKASDERPRILDFLDPTVGSRYAAYQNVLWPCLAYRIDLPVKPQERLNLLEETILRLASVGLTHKADLENLTCLPESLIFFLKSRLAQMGLLGERGDLIDNGKKYIEQLSEGQVEIIRATAFIEMKQGTLLPSIITEKPSYAIFLSKKGDDIEFQSPRDSDNKSAEILSTSIPDANIKHPTPIEIERLINNHRRLYTRYAPLFQNSVSCPEFTGDVDQINIFPKPEKIYLHTLIVWPEGGEDFLIADPFNFGCSDILLQSLECTINKNEALILRLKEKADITTHRTEKRSKKNHPAGFRPTKKKYPDILQELLKAETQREQFEKPVNTSSAERNQNISVLECASSIYRAIEFVLAQIIIEYPVDEYQGLMASQRSSSNEELMTVFARRVRFQLKGLNRILFENILPGKIRAVATGSTELQPLLALALAGAAYDPSHPLTRLAEYQPDWLINLTRLHTIRNKADHGQWSEYGLTTHEMSWLHEYFKQTIICLFPETGSKEKSSLQHTYNSSKNTYLEEKRHKARIRLDRRLGVQKVRLMSQDLLDSVLLVETEEIDIETDGAAECSRMIKHMTSAIQILLYNLIRNSSQLHLSKKPAEQAIARAEEAGFKIHQADNLKSIRTVNPKRIRIACRRINATLGANLIAMLLTTPLDLLTEISRRQPDLVLLTDRLAGLRQHNRRAFLSSQEVNSLREDFFNGVKKLMEH